MIAPVYHVILANELRSLGVMANALATENSLLCWPKWTQCSFNICDYLAKLEEAPEV